MALFFNPRKRLSLQINLAIWAVCAMIVVGFGAFFHTFEKHQHQERVDQIAVLLQTVFEQNREQLANEIFAGHHGALAYTLAAIDRVKGITSVQAFDPEGIGIGDAGARHFDNLPLETRQQLTHGAVLQSMEIGQHPHLVLITPIEAIGEHWGYFFVAFDLSNLHRVFRTRILLFVLVFSCLLAVLSILLHILLHRRVIRPVSVLGNAMDRVMAGHLNQQLTFGREDEIGQMAETFNAMSARLEEQHERLRMSVAARDTYAGQLEESNRKLARLNADLEGIVDERTRELRTSYEKLQAETQERRELEERLAQSKKMEALGLLAGGVAHDLNNVLSGIISYPEMILMDLPPDDPLRKPVAGIQRSGQKAAAIVEDLLTLARRGVTQIQLLHLNRDVIDDYLNSPEFARLRGDYPAVHVETRLAPDLLNIAGSPIPLKKTVLNLVTNAAEAQPDGGRILITTENCYVDSTFDVIPDVGEGEYVRLCVEDQGMGIAPEDLDRIFEPFYTKKVMGRSGTGLGMAVVWGTVQDHHGHIHVESRTDTGTTFNLLFPATRQVAVPDEAPGSIEDYRGRGETVLVIDDIVEQRRIVEALLTRLNYRVFAVDSGEAAISFIQHRKMDILVLDMIMEPGIDGLETYRRILALNPAQKCIVASGFADNDRIAQVMEMGAGAYIRKPYILSQIGLALRDTLNRPPPSG